MKRKPCSTCPFRRSTPSGKLGGSPVETYIGQTQGGFWIPCHESIDYDNPNWHSDAHPDLNKQCAGEMQFRANVGSSIPRIAGLEHTDEIDHEIVFSTREEFMSYHSPDKYPTVKHASDALKVMGAHLLAIYQHARPTTKEYVCKTK